MIDEKRLVWSDYVGKYVRVGQEVQLDNTWSEIEFEGWVAEVVNGTLKMDNGEEWVVEDGEEFVRNSKLLPCTSRGLPAWQRSPNKWIKEESGWKRTPVEPKIEDCDCSSCSLYDNTLVDDKSRFEECDVLFVGEAPGFEEQSAGKFFVGRAGKLLKALIAQTGAGKFRVGYNNTCICYANEAPTEEDIKACKKRLLREIQQCSPRLVVAVGGVALQALTGMTGITEHQGMLIDWAIEGESGVGEEYESTSRKLKLLPCFHSAAVLRRPELFYTFAETIYKAALYLQGNVNLDVQPSDFDVRVVTEDSFAEALRVLGESSKLYVDLETTDYSPYKDKIICVSVSYQEREEERVIVDNEDGHYEGRVKEGGRASRRSYVFPWELVLAHFDEFKHLLETIPSNYWNAFFDAQFLRQNGIKPLVEGDMMLKHYTLDETPLSQSLKGTARTYCNAPDWEEPLRQYLPTRSTSFSAIPREVLYPYNGYDSGYTAVLDDILTERMDENNKRVYDEILVPALNMFLDTCNVGMRVDVSRLSELRVELQAKMIDLQKQLEEMSGVVGFNPSSIKDARHLIKDVLGIGEEGGSTSRTALEDYKGIAGVDLLLQFRETRKLLGTYVDGLVDDLIEGEGEAVVHPNIRLNGTVTGRLSSANPNFFGIPDEKGGIKKLYKARYEGWGVGNGDGAQMEIRVLGARSGDKRLIEDFVRGVDFHGAARNRLFGRGASKENYTHQEVLDAKTAVFGPIYGRGAESLAQQFHHSEIAELKARGEKIRWFTWSSLPRDEKEIRIAQAQEHIDKLWEPYPVALSWLRENVKIGQENGELVSYYGRYRHWGLITDENIEDIKTQGRNFPVQSPSSDTNLLVMLSSYQHFSRDVYVPIFPVHDSVVFTYKLGEESWLIPELKTYFEKRAQELLHTDMKFVYEFTIGPNWGEQTEWKGGKE